VGDGFHGSQAHRARDLVPGDARLDRAIAPRNGCQAEPVGNIPTHVRHYYRAARRPFLNLSDLTDEQLDSVIDGLMVERLSGDHRRAFGRRYMELRRRTEAKMRRLFIEAGGRPERTSPHYFVLGESRWFEGLADDMCTVELSIDQLPESSTSVTYPDSFTAMAIAPKYGLPYEPRPYHEQVFPLGQLHELIEKWGLPEDPVGGYENYEGRPFEMYVEIQVWSDEPVRPFLAGGD
jgi:hypothetical protein